MSKHIHVNPALAKKDDAPKKVFIKTFGCQMNEYDSNRMLDSLNESCLLYTSDAADE